MGRLGGIEQRRRRATAGALSFLAQGGDYGESSNPQLLVGNAWQKFSAGGRLHPDFDLLMAEYPEAQSVWEAKVWSVADESLDAHALTGKLFQLCSTKPQSSSLSALLDNLTGSPIAARMEMDGIARYVCALRLPPRTSETVDRLVYNLFGSLLLMSCSGLYVACAAEVLQLMTHSLAVGSSAGARIRTLGEDVLLRFRRRLAKAEGAISTEVSGDCLRVRLPLDVRQCLVAPVIQDLIGDDRVARARSEAWIGR